MERPAPSIFAYSTPDRPIPPALLIGAAVLMVTTVVSIAVARHTGIGVSVSAPSPASVSRTLVFEPAPQDGITVEDAATGMRVASMPADSFVREAIRGMQRNRGIQAVDPKTPYQLLLSRDGAVWLLDPATGSHVDMQAFGHTNAGAFEKLLGAPAVAENGGS